MINFTIKKFTSEKFSLDYFQIERKTLNLKGIISLVL